MHGEVHAAERDGGRDLFLAVDGQLGGRVLLVLGHEARTAHEHAARAAGGVEDAAVEGFEDFDNEADDAGRRVELAALLALGARERAEEVFVDAAEGVVVEARRDFGDFLQQLFQQGAVEDFVGLGQHPGELRVVLLDVAHRLVRGLADVAALGQREEIVETGIGREVEHTFGVIGGGLVHPRAAAARGGAGLFKLRATGGETHFGKAQEDEAQDRCGILRGVETGVGAELIGRRPQAIFKRGVGGVFFGGGDPVHPIGP